MGRWGAIAAATLPGIEDTEKNLPSHSQRTAEERRIQPPAQPVCLSEAMPLLRSVVPTCTTVERSVKNGLVNVYFPVPDLYVETAIRMSAYPGLVVNRCPLTTKVGQRHQFSLLAFLALR